MTAAIRAGDEEAFNHLAGRHRRELLIHCYRMLGFLDDAEDGAGCAAPRMALSREPQRRSATASMALPRGDQRLPRCHLARRTAFDSRQEEDGPKIAMHLPADEVAWLQPIPDSLIEPILKHDADPETIALSRETIELAFLTVIQLLTPQQRAALILCDVLGWSAKEAGALLDVSTAAVNSALQRARVTLQRPAAALAEAPSGHPARIPASPSASCWRKYVDASEKADLGALTSIIRNDAICLMPPQPGIAVGRDAMFKLWADGGFGSERFGRLRCVLTRANLRPAAAAYVLRPRDTAWRALALDALRIEEGVITEIVTFPGQCLSAVRAPADDEPTGGKRAVAGRRRRETMNAPPHSPLRRSSLPNCSPRASGCRSTCTSSTIPMRACWWTPV